MFRIVLSVSSALACLKWGAWRRWKEFYPTILFVIVGDLVYNFVFYNYSLWEYENLINHTVSDLLIAATVFPFAIIIYLTHWPATRLKQTAYILGWSIGLSLIEYLSVVLGCFSHSNGWTIFHSFVVYAGACLMIRLHLKHPLVVWPIGGILLVLTAWYFQLPFELIK